MNKKIDLDTNPTGTPLKVARQHQREKGGRFIAVPGDKNHTRIFVRHGQDPDACIAAYLSRLKSRPKMWN